MLVDGAWKVVRCRGGLDEAGGGVAGEEVVAGAPWFVGFEVALDDPAGVLVTVTVLVEDPPQPAATRVARTRAARVRRRRLNTGRA